MTSEPQEEVIYAAHPAKRAPFHKVSSHLNDVSASNREQVRFLEPIQPQKAFKVSTPCRFGFKMPEIEAFRGLANLHSIQYYDRMISRMIGECHRG